MDEPLYEAFYGLREQPFALSADPRFIFWSASHRRAFDDLLLGLRRREGVLLLTGETGTGKTTLCRAVIDSLGHRTFSALVLNPYMVGTEVLRVILRDFGLVSRDEIRRGSLSRADVPQLLDTLESFLRSLVPLEARAVLIVDEAQSLSSEALDQIRLLGSYEEGGQRLLQILLCGQPNLLNTLKTEPMRALNERITRRAGLTPLLAPEVEAYVRHRLAVAGGSDTVTFQPEAFGLISEYSRGLPRRINVLCDRALDEGRMRGSAVITADLLKTAARSLSTPGPPAAPVAAPPAPQPPPAAAAVEPIGEPENVPPEIPDEVPADPSLGIEEPTPVAMEFTLEQQSSGGSRGALGVVGALIVVVGLFGGYFAWSTVDENQAPPTVQGGPPADQASPAAAFGLPSADDLKALMDGHVPGDTAGS
jgi:general secretion pathway protein A